MTRIIGALLARNEAAEDRYLTRVIRDAQRWADDIVVLDDNSSDDTPEIAEALGCLVFKRGDAPPMWGAEAPARKYLWELASGEADDGWVLVFDADMILVGDPRPLAESWEVNAWSFVLYDMWSETQYRRDSFWQGHLHPRPWMFCPSRVPNGWQAQWPERGLHCGHAPANFPLVHGIAPSQTPYWLHLAYSTSDARRRKHAQYLGQRARLTAWESAHAESILDGERISEILAASP